MSSLVVLFAVIAAALAAPHVQKRSIGHAVAYSVPAAVSHQSRVDVHSSPAVVASQLVAQPVLEARTYAAPVAYAAYAPAAVSHQSRVDVRTSPAVVAHTPVVAEPAYYAEPVVAARTVYAAPHTAYVGSSAVTHQSRVDVETSPAVVSEHVVAPAFLEARSAWAPSVYSSW